MNFYNVFLAALFASHAVASGVTLLRSDDNGGIMASKACEKFRLEVGMVNMDPMLHGHTFEDISDFICGPLGRQFLQGKLDGLQQIGATGNPCARSLRDMMAVDASMLADVIEDEATCRLEVSKELEVWASGHPSNLSVTDSQTRFVNAAIVFLFSDERLKEDIHYVGKSPSGIPTYTFKYRADMVDILDGKVDTKSTYFGVMAQDLLELAPDAVVVECHNGDYYCVDYSKIDVSFIKLV